MGSSFLKIGAMLPHFHLSGKDPNDKVLFSSLYSEGPISSAVRFRSRPGISSGPVALFVWRFLRAPVTTGTVSTKESRITFSMSMLGFWLSVDSASEIGLNTECKKSFSKFALSRLSVMNDRPVRKNLGDELSDVRLSQLTKNAWDY